MAGVLILDALSSLTGKKIAFRIHSYDCEADVVIGSRKDTIDQMAAITMKYVKKDDIIIAVVQNVKQKPRIVDVGGILSTIPFGEVRYGWVEDLRQLM
ncbi:hypothetical protein JFL43_09795 [Viridibacillus sp. YIM B01967]|uniref:Uncharacterized protein n=1 Tax=Viridibacillus soli TaxID=2798301 RepID=A0ABS1H6U0_9BACL|nr:hypothetical protein [Viridibacillus soli]MBK3495142.1 hypothetical protein [Viridibacillus soli]